tara:strand:+ start:1422 stop:2618 length:1197 start_codon:yes stop_codon:yes gene_type:complete
MFYRYVKNIFLVCLYSINIVSFSLNAEECDWQEAFAEIEKALPIDQEKLCQALPNIRTKAELEEILKHYYDQVKKLEDPSDRHKTTKNTNKCLPTKNSKVLIIAFEGTGAYEPLIPPMISNFNKCFGGKIDSKIQSKVYSISKEILKKDKGRDSKWSSLQAGIMSELVTMKKSHQVDWYSFPSEEVEQLAGLEQLENASIRSIYNDIKNSVNGNPKGIQNARDCVIQYMNEAKRLGIEPKISLTSHSSGGRSLVKFAEFMKKDVGVDVDLAFSIDPVKEAHHAIEEVLPQKATEPARYLAWKIKGGKYPYSAVWSRSQPSKLYNPGNVTKYLNFFQIDDRNGLKMGGDAGRFAIQGSPISGADENIHVRHTGMSGHGEIGYNKVVTERFRKELEELLK